jgi:hypothetical protein
MFLLNQKAFLLKDNMIMLSPPFLEQHLLILNHTGTHLCTKMR